MNETQRQHETLTETYVWCDLFNQQLKNSTKAEYV